MLGIPATGRTGEASHSLSRSTVEDAMDAYVRFQESGEHQEVFGRFGDAQAYWVRSTRPRSNQVFPSKAIVGFASPSNNLSGGWSSKSTAASRLHNSGYIIVDEQNQPVAPPSDKPFLIGDVDRVRMCALNYFIEPARERGEHQAWIRAGQLGDELLLGERISFVCQTISSKEFQELARVAPPARDGPDESKTTVFTFDLLNKDDQSALQSEPVRDMQKTTNLILYGPPGTGKTYKTAWEAVRLCLGDDRAAGLSGSERREALMVQYHKLVEAGRIEFVTFHQSMSYEEFVEGLRPETGIPDASEMPEDTQTTGGFRLVPQDGIFKRISEKARLEVGDNPPKSRLDRSRNVFRYGLTGSNWKEELEGAVSEPKIDTWFGGEIDWSDSKYEDWAEIKARRQEDNPDVRGNHWSVYGVSIVRSFAEIGDYIMLTAKKIWLSRSAA